MVKVEPNIILVKEQAKRFTKLLMPLIARIDEPINLNIPIPLNDPNISGCIKQFFASEKQFTNIPSVRYKFKIMIGQSCKIITQFRCISECSPYQIHSRKRTGNSICRGCILSPTWIIYFVNDVWIVNLS